MIIQNHKPSIYVQLANKYNLPIYIIETICNSPFGFANKHISEGDDKTIMMMYLGKFKKKKMYLNEQKY